MLGFSTLEREMTVDELGLSGELPRWLSGTSFLLVFDAANLSELARAPAPHHIPYGFHGQFARA